MTVVAHIAKPLLVKSDQTPTQSQEADQLSFWVLNFE